MGDTEIDLSSITESGFTDALVKTARDDRAHADTSAAPLDSGLMALDVRHDLRHVAATILLLLATVSDPPDDDATRTVFDAIAHCARNINAMIDDDREPSALLVAIDELAAYESRRAALLYGAIVTFDVEPVLVHANPVDISRLLMNLVDNSCRATGPTGTVQVTARARGEWCAIEVADSGPGFVDSFASTGVGLSSIAAIAVRLNGFVTLSQSSLGGALVTVHLPRASTDPVQYEKDVAA